ncbi:MAG: PAS domain S-box protein [Melioribacteraceae bacterium]|nr:PAS domain S-box protein [Melioribacteraceae bacterium]
MADKKKNNNTKKNSATTKKIKSKKKTSSIQNLKSIYFDTIFKNSGLGIVIFKPDGTILKVNDAALKMSGYSENELKSISNFLFVHPDDVNSTQKQIKQILEGKISSYKTEKRYITKDKKILHTILSVAVVKKYRNKPTELIAIVENVSETKQAKSELAYEQALLNSLLDGIPDSIYFKDVNSRFIKVNKAMLRKHNFNNDQEILGKTDFELFGAEHAKQAFEDEQNIIQTGIPIINKEEKEDWLDGRTTWVSTTKMPLYDKDGKIIGTFGLSRDITDKVEAEEQIKNSEKLFRSLFENSIDGMFLMLDVVLDCNQAVCDMLQYSKNELLGLSPADFSPEYQPNGKKSLDYANEKINEALNGNPQRFMWIHKRKDGTLIETDVSLKEVSISGNKLVQAILRDVTKRNKNEKIREALFEISEAAFTAQDIYQLYEKIHKVVGKLMSSKNFYIAIYNEADETISFPYWVDEFDPPQPTKKLGKGLTEYVLRTGQAALINPEKDLELRRLGEVELIGSPQAIWLGVPLKVENKTIGVIVVQDYENEKAFGEEEVQILTFVSEQIAQAIERKRRADEIQKIADELSLLNSTKDKFFSIIAHDLRNPFITILGFTDLLLTDYKELNESEVMFYLEEMKKSAEISHNLLQNLLQWSRSQTGRIEFHPAKINLKNLVNVNLELLQPSATNKEIEIKSEVEESLYVFADEDMLNTIIRNLITNAIKFTPIGGKITVASKEIGKYAEISVTDTGVGMSESTISNLFKLDSTHSTLGTNQEAGTGLGLILCKEFVEKHGGKIWVESKINEGSKFIFYLPLAE